MQPRDRQPVPGIWSESQLKPHRRSRLLSRALVLMAVAGASYIFGFAIGTLAVWLGAL